MLVVLGGFIGNGRGFLGPLLAKEMGFYYYPLLEKKKQLYLDNKHRLHERIMEPSTDPARAQLYREVLKDFRLLSKMYPDVIVEDTFHREKPREFFLQEARRYFSPVVFVWIESPDETAVARLQRAERIKLVPSAAKAIHTRSKTMKEFEPFSGALIFFHRISNRAAARALLGLINQSVKRGLAS